jgi:uncharacterized protein involved in exopolysaccharide biosynthesis
LVYNQDVAEQHRSSSVHVALIDDTKNSTYRLFLRSRWFVLRCAMAGGLLFALVALLVPTRYESVAELMPPDQNQNSSGLIAATADRVQSLGLPVDLLGAKTPSALFVSIMTSETVENAVIKRFDLRRVYRARYLETARQTLEENTDVTEDRKSGVITIRVRDRDRRRAQQICETYVSELNRLVTQLSTSSARREREFLEQRLAIVKKEVDQSAAALGQFSSTNTTVDVPEQGKAMVVLAATLQGNLIAAEAELKGLKQIYADQNTRVRSAQSRVAELQRNMHLLAGDSSSASSSPEMVYPSIRKLPLLGVTYADLLRQAKLSGAIFEALTKQYELAKVQEAKEIPSVRLLDSPSYPEKHVSPQRAMITAFGGLLGLIFGGAGVLWKKLPPEDTRRELVLEASRELRNDIDKVVRRFHRNGAR